MATKKTTKKAAAKTAPKKAVTAKTTTTKTTVKRVNAETKQAATTKTVKVISKLPSNLINIVVAETIGTFILTLVALFAAGSLAPLYVGLTLMLAVMSIGAISGAHINPAVTFGLWTMRKIKTTLVPFYWAAQFLGAMAAVVLLSSLTSNTFAIHFDHFANFSWGVFAIELIGMAIFMFALAGVLSRNELKDTGRAVGVGFSLTLGLLVASTILPMVQTAAYTKFTKEQAATKEAKQAYPREVYINGATLNPAVALAVTEKTDSTLQNNSPVVGEGEKAYSRLSLEVILATLIGAALGGNLYLLVNYRNKTEE